MKKLLLSLAVIASATFLATAQDTKTKKETKTVVTGDNKETKTTVKDEKTTKKTSTVPQKVHNTFSKDKQYSGKKTKHKRTKTVEKKADPAQ